MEYRVMTAASRDELDYLTREFLKNEPAATGFLFENYYDVILNNMALRPGQKLLISEDANTINGFVKYNVTLPQPGKTIGELTNIFSLGDVTPLRQDKPISRQDVTDYFPFSLYTNSGSLVFIDHIEVPSGVKRRGMGKGLLEKLTSIENPEMIEALAHPSSIRFWNKMNYYYSSPVLHSQELAVIGWMPHFSNLSSSWGVYKESKFNDGNATLTFCEIGITEGMRYAIYDFVFQADGTSICKASRAAVGMDIDGNIPPTKIKLNSVALEQIISTMPKRVSPESIFHQKVMELKVE